jgi:hypothetical protein
MFHDMTSLDGIYLLTLLYKIIPGTIGQGLFTLGLAFSGCNATAAIVLSTAATAVSGAVTTGPLASFIDISPNFASEFHSLSTAA